MNGIISIKTRAIILCGMMVASAVCNAQTNAAGGGAVPASDIVAKGEGIVITRGQLEAAARNISHEHMEEMTSEMSPLKVEQIILDSLINKTLVLARATEADRIKGREKFEENLKFHREALKLSEQQYDKYLSERLPEWGMTRERWQSWNTENLLMPIVIDRELESEITEAQIKKYYERNAAAYEQPEKVQVNYIFLSTLDPVTRKALPEEGKKNKQKRMGEVLKRVRNGEDFQKLFKEYSETPDISDQKGEYILTRGLLPSVEFESAFSLKRDEVSDIITGDTGYFIFKLSERTPARKLELSEVRNDIKQSLITAHTRAYLDRIRQEAKLLVHKENVARLITKGLKTQSDLKSANVNQKPQP